jgi:hypothetical protein
VVKKAKIRNNIDNTCKNGLPKSEFLCLEHLGDALSRTNEVWTEKLLSRLEQPRPWGNFATVGPGCSPVSGNQSSHKYTCCCLLLGEGLSGTTTLYATCCIQLVVVLVEIKSIYDTCQTITPVYFLNTQSSEKIVKKRQSHRFHINSSILFYF